MPGPELATVTGDRGDTLRARRVELGWSQAGVARRLGVSRTYGNMIEAGKRAGSGKFWGREVLGIDGHLPVGRQLPDPLRGAGRVSPPWGIVEAMRRLCRSDLGGSTLELVQATTEELCCEYPYRDPAALRAESAEWLGYVGTALDGRVSLAEHRELLVTAGWLSLLIGCLEYDMGMRRQAESSRLTAAQLGVECGHADLIAWGHEMTAWFALSEGDYPRALAAAQAGQAVTTTSSVAVQLVVHEARAQARMGAVRAVHEALDRGFAILGRHDRPTRRENHFVIDPSKWDFYAMDCYRLLGDRDRAVEHATGVITDSIGPDGRSRWPMRASQAQMALAVLAVQDGDLDGGMDHAHVAMTESRRSLMSLVGAAREVVAAMRAIYPAEQITAEFVDELRALRAGLPAD